MVSIYQIVMLLTGASLFLLGLAIGGVIEYRRLSKRSEEREEVYLYNLEQTAQMIYRVESKVDRLSVKSDDRWKATEAIHLAVVDTETTQTFRLREPTPPMPWRLGDDPDATDPGFDT